MILPFSTQLNGKPTHFVSKIIKGLEPFSASESDKQIIREALDFGYFDFDTYDNVSPKIHTIREDVTDRWQAGVMIDFFINNRRPDMFRFAPRLPCTETQEIFMTLIQGRFEVSVDDRQLCLGELEKLALNDGFESFDDFRDYFISQMTDGVFKGKLIHWTDKRY